MSWRAQGPALASLPIRQEDIVEMEFFRDYREMELEPIVSFMFSPDLQRCQHKVRVLGDIWMPVRASFATKAVLGHKVRKQ